MSKSITASSARSLGFWTSSDKFSCIQMKNHGKRQEFLANMEAADKGDAYAKSWIGHACENGLGTEVDLVEALKWHMAAAQSGEAYSQCWLGWAFHYGKIVRRSRTTSFRWYRRAALQGYACGEYNVGNAYSEGSGVNRNPKLAVKWWRRAALQGDAYAQNNLGDAYEDGVGVKRNIREAHSFYTAAARGGDTVARFNLARFKLATGSKKKAQAEFKSIIPKLRKAAQTNDSAALLCLGDCAYFGWGMEMNKKLAAERYRAAKRMKNIPMKR